MRKTNVKRFVSCVALLLIVASMLSIPAAAQVVPRYSFSNFTLNTGKSTLLGTVSMDAGETLYIRISSNTNNNKVYITLASSTGVDEDDTFLLTTGEKYLQASSTGTHYIYLYSDGSSATTKLSGTYTVY